MKATFAMAALYHAARAAASVGVVLGCACASGHVGPPGDGGGSGGPGDAGTQPGWVVASREDFQQTSIPDAAWERDPVPDDGPFADDGAFFRARGVVPPVAYRTSAPLGADGWLRIESYTRSASRAFHDLAQVTADPADPSNRVLRITSPAHTDRTATRAASAPNRGGTTTRPRRTASTGSPSSTRSRDRTTTPGSTITGRSSSTRTTITRLGWRCSTEADSR